MNYKVIKVLNNNVVFAQQKQQEVILVSKGIGFGKKPGDRIYVDSQTIEKVFHELNTDGTSNYFEMLPKHNEEIAGVSEEIIAKAETILGSLSPNIHAALIDHITFALDRIHIGLPIENPFIDEIILLYQEEFDVAEIAASLLKKRLGVDIGDDEKGFIALHLHSARNNKTIRETMTDTRIFKGMIEIVAKETGKAPTNSVYQSFIPSMRTMLQHCRSNKTMYNPLIEEIKSKMRESYIVAQEIADIIQEKQNIHLSEAIMAYIAVDIEKIRQL